ncbi:MAG: hypothetical protein ABII08_00095 [Candidatus Beckwithbacteria bacterium]|nr:hypothetical protein [Patescibacteria group bacterium]
MMLRKQLYLTEELDQKLKLLSLSLGKPVAEITRQTIKIGLENTKKKIKPLSGLLSIVGEGIGPKDLSKNLDNYLYGSKSSKWGRLYKK